MSLHTLLEHLLLEHTPLERSRRARAIQQQRRQDAWRMMLRLLALACLLATLGAISASAQESDPQLNFGKPSDEMDFSLPTLPDLPSTDAAPDDEGASGGLYTFGDPLPSLPPADEALTDEALTSTLPELTPSDAPVEDFSTLPALPEPDVTTPSDTAPDTLAAPLATNEESGDDNAPVLPPLAAPDDMTLPEPAQDVTQGEPQPPLIDQFFSTTSIIAPDAKPKAEEKSADTTEAKPKPKKKVASHKPRHPTFQKPPHVFKSVRLPEAIYHDNYSRDNKHLPLAYTQSRQQELFADAIRRHDLGALRALYTNGASIEATTGNDGTPMLVLAAQHHNVDALRWMLQHRANANVADAHGLSALHYASYTGNHQMVNLLLSYGASASAQSNTGHDAYAYAALGRNTQVDTLLLNVPLY